MYDIELLMKNTPHGIINAFTVDLEDWYQGLEIDNSHWDIYQSRIEIGTHKLLDLLGQANTKATFFVLGRNIPAIKNLLLRIRTAGHELGTHGMSHRFVYHLTPNQFRDEIRESIDQLQNFTGCVTHSHRAPFFSITKSSLWALSILREEGILYDSSIFPVVNYRYGIPDAPRRPFSVKTEAGQIYEFPISTHSSMLGNIPFAGGFYLRFYAYPFVRLLTQRLNREGIPVIFYIHPWELDPQHPRIMLPKRIGLTHYWNLESTETKIRRLLGDFRFGTVRDAMTTLITGRLCTFSCANARFDLVPPEKRPSSIKQSMTSASVDTPMS